MEEACTDEQREVQVPTIEEQAVEVLATDVHPVQVPPSQYDHVEGLGAEKQPLEVPLVE